jgi:peptidoglycan/LPS O-acetylase OafA/YrhL
LTDGKAHAPLLPGLQYYRALAALLIVFYHAALKRMNSWFAARGL